MTLELGSNIHEGSRCVSNRCCCSIPPLSRCSASTAPPDADGIVTHEWMDPRSRRGRRPGPRGPPNSRRADAPRCSVPSVVHFRRATSYTLGLPLPNAREKLALLAGSCKNSKPNLVGKICLASSPISFQRGIDLLPKVFLPGCQKPRRAAQFAATSRRRVEGRWFARRWP